MYTFIYIRALPGASTWIKCSLRDFRILLVSQTFTDCRTVPPGAVLSFQKQNGVNEARSSRASFKDELSSLVKKQTQTLPAARIRKGLSVALGLISSGIAANRGNFLLAHPVLVYECMHEPPEKVVTSAFAQAGGRETTGAEEEISCLQNVYLARDAVKYFFLAIVQNPLES